MPPDFKTSKSLSPYPSSLALLIMLGCVFVLPTSAKDDIFGTPDADGDGDGDPVGNGFPFTTDSGITDVNGDPIYNTHSFQSNFSTEYWTTSQGGSDHWTDYTVFPDTQNQLASRLTETLSPGDSYFYRQSSFLGMEGYTMAWRDSNANLPTGTLMSFGFGFDGEPMDIDGGTIKGDNLTNLFDASGTDGPLTGTTVAPTGYDGSLGNYLWYNYEVDAQGSQSVFTISNPEFNGNLSQVGDIIWLIKFPDTLVVGETMPAYTPWALSGYDKDGDFVSVTPGDEYWLTPAGDGGDGSILPQIDDPTNDLVFSWTVDNKASEWGDENSNVLPLIPEPRVSVMAALSMLLLTFRRKRH